MSNHEIEELLRLIFEWLDNKYLVKELNGSYEPYAGDTQEPHELVQEFMNDYRSGSGWDWQRAQNVVGALRKPEVKIPMRQITEEEYQQLRHFELGGGSLE